MIDLPSPEAITRAAYTIFEVLRANDDISATKAELRNYCNEHDIDAQLFGRGFTWLTFQLGVIIETSYLRGSERIWKVKLKERDTTRAQLAQRCAQVQRLPHRGGAKH